MFFFVIFKSKKRVSLLISNNYDNSYEIVYQSDLEPRRELPSCQRSVYIYKIA